MSTLTEKPAEKQASVATPPVILQSRHRWLRWRGLLIVGTAGLATTLLAVAFMPASWHTPAHAAWLGALWGGGIIVTAIAGALAYRFAPDSLVVTARLLDQRFDAKNRLEAIATAQDSSSPLWRAQHDETSLFLNREPKAKRIRALPWLLGGFLVLLAAHLAFLAIWLVPMLTFVPKPKPPAPPAKVAPIASITWRSPEPEIKANPIEEVPTQAMADSTTGLENLTLEMSINGEAKKSTPIPAEPYTKPGSHEIKVSVYLDELDAQPFDIVSYYLRGQRIASEKLPDVASALQFIQVRPFRDDYLQGAGRMSKGYALLLRLKLAQLTAIKENFVLAHTDLPPDHPVRMKENERVGKNQVALAAKTDEVVQAFIDGGANPKIIDLLLRARPFMDEAGKEILATRNGPALTPQQKALDLIIQAEKFVIKGIGPLSPGPTSPNPNDPFGDKQKHELTKRLTAPSGQLEALAQHQQHLSQDLNQNSDNPTTPAPNSTPAAGTSSSAPATPAPAASDDGTPPALASQATDPFTPDADKGSFAERQARIVQGIEVLRNGNKVLPETVTDALASAQKHAAASLQQIEAGQPDSAREPAAAAARDLQLAVNGMNDTGAEETKQAMAAAQQRLNDLANQLRALAESKPADADQRLMDLAKQVSELRRQLENAADHQEEAGSEKGALQLNTLAEKIRQQQFATNLADMSKAQLDPGHLSAMADQMEDLADQAAHGLMGAQPSGQDYAKLINALQRSRANLQRLAEKAGGLPAGAPSPGTAPSQQPGNPGQGQVPSPGQKPGQGSAQSPSPGQSPGQGQTPGQPGSTPTPGASHGESPSPTPGSSGSNPNSPPGPGGTGDASAQRDDSVQKAYASTLQNLQDQVQQAQHLSQDGSASALGRMVIRYDTDRQYREVSPANVVRYCLDLQKPLEKLIFDLQVLQEHAQRSEIVKTPDLDDTPLEYRSAVSDYFEEMSRDYHPPAPAGPAPESKP